MKEKMLLGILGLFLSWGMLASVSQIFAQEGINDSNAVAQGGGAVDSFNLLWLLPWIIIPFLVYILWPMARPDRNVMETNEFAGEKGGRAERRRDLHIHNLRKVISNLVP